MKREGAISEKDVGLAFEYSLEPFDIRFKRCSREPETWKAELQTIALSLANDAGNRPIVVCSSGGIDSELVCSLLLEQGIHFSVLTVEHVAGTNEREISYAKKWCAEHRIEQKIVRLDMRDFMSNTIENYIQDGYISDNVFRYFQIFLLEKVEELGGFAVLGGGEQIYEVRSSQDTKVGDAYLEFRSNFVTVLEWMRRNQRIHRPFFYYSTPEAALAYLKTPIVDFAVRNPEIFIHPSNTYRLNRIVMHYLWPNLGLRTKMTGFDEIMDSRLEVEGTLRDRFEDSIKTFKISVESFRQQLQIQ